MQAMFIYQVAEYLKEKEKEKLFSQYGDTS